MHVLSKFELRHVSRFLWDCSASRVILFKISNCKLIEHRGNRVTINTSASLFFIYWIVVFWFGLAGDTIWKTPLVEPKNQNVEWKILAIAGAMCLIIWLVESNLMIRFHFSNLQTLYKLLQNLSKNQRYKKHYNDIVIKQQSRNCILVPKINSKNTK